MDPTMSRSKTATRSLGEYQILSRRFTVEVSSTFIHGEACCELKTRCLATPNIVHTKQEQNQPPGACRALTRLQDPSLHGSKPKLRRELWGDQEISRNVP